MVGQNEVNIKKRAKKSLLIGLEQVHTDDLYDIDDCIEIKKVSSFYIHIIKSNNETALKFNNGYLTIPKKIINEYKLLNGLK